MSRYSRHIVLSEIGQEGQDKLSQSKVLVIGAGGLGCPILQYLTAAGVGTLGIVDFDVVEESNLQRQILFGSSSIAINKALAAKARLEDLNPTIVIEPYPEMLTSANALDLFQKYDVVVDGTDNFTTRYLINDASIITNKPLVYGAIYKFEGQVSVFNYQGGPSYRCLFPEPPKEGSVANCSEVGVLGVLPGIIGCMQANEVIKIIVGFENVLSGQLYCFNAKTNQTSTIKIVRSNAQFEKVMARKDDFENYFNETICETPVRDISAAAALQKEDAIYIDVREAVEEPKVDFRGCIHIPLGQLEQNLDRINSEKNIIVFCQVGIRSKTAVEILQKHNFDNCYNLKEGATALEEQLKIKT